MALVPLAAFGKLGLDESQRRVLDHFLLPVDPDGSSREIRQRDPMALALEAHLLRRRVGPQQVALRPDVIIVRNEKGDFEVEVIESRRFSLRVNPVYRQLVGQLQAARSAGAAAPTMTDDERQHIRQYVTRAKFFIDNINQRRQTIGRITDVIVECQRDFLEKGVQSLRPLTRAEVGERIGMHESTVSRATAGKFVLLPAGEVIPFSTFFTASLGVKDVIKNIIEAEDHSRPYSDQEIVEKLREDHGIRLARRTVAKYREELQILPARLRKR